MPKLFVPAATNFILDPRLEHDTAGLWDFLGVSSTLANAYTENLIPATTYDTGLPWASHVAGAGYESWRAFDHSDASSYWHSGVASFPMQLGYQFATAKTITRYTITTRDSGQYAPKTWTFEGSNDNATWTTLDTQTNVTGWDASATVRKVFNLPLSKVCLYYRLNISAGNDASSCAVVELEMMEFRAPDITPQMTSATAPSGVVTASGAIYAAWLAFDHVNPAVEDSSWLSNFAGSAWLQYQFPAAHVITRYAVTSRNVGATRAPKTWTFKGSNDGSTWATLDTQTNVTGWALIANVRKVFDFVNTTAYAYYRLDITASNHASYVGVGELEMMEDVDATKTIVGDTDFNWQRIQYTADAGDDGSTSLYLTGNSMLSAADAAWMFSVKGSSAGFVLGVKITPFDGATMLADVEQIFTIAGDARDVKVCYPDLPAGTDRVAIQIHLGCEGPDSVVDLFFSRPILVPDEDVDAWFSGASPACSWSGSVDASTSTRPASALTYRRRFANWQQGTIAGVFVPLVDSDSAGWTAQDSIVNVGRGYYGGGVGVNYWYPGNPLMAIANSLVVDHGYTGSPATWLAGSRNVFVATWKNLDHIRLWVNGVEGTFGVPMDISVFNGESVINVGQFGGGAGVGFGSGKAYVGPLIISEEVKDSRWIANILAGNGAAFDDLNRLFRVRLSPTDMLIPLETDSTAIVKGTSQYIDPLNGNYLLMCDGNSITYGTGALPGTTDYPHVLEGLLPGGWDLLTPQVTGQSTTGCIGGAPYYFDPFLNRARAYEDSFVVFSEAVNSLSQVAQMPADELALYHTYCDARRAAGWKHVIVMTMTPSADAVPEANAIAGGFTGFEQKRTAFNTLLRAGYADFADALVDVGANAYVGNRANCGTAPYFADAVHLSGTGLAIVAGMVKPVIESFL